MKAVYLIGGGPLAWRVPGWARAAGLAPIVADRNPRAPGLAGAAEQVHLDGTDVAGHVAAASELAHRYEIVGAYCGGEHGVETARRVAESLGLATNTAEAVAIALDKASAKEVLRSADVPTPGGGIVHDAGDIKRCFHDGPARWILKPSGGSGSRGVRVISEDDDLVSALAACRRGAPGAVVAEPFLEDGRSMRTAASSMDATNPQASWRSSRHRCPNACRWGARIRQI